MTNSYPQDKEGWWDLLETDFDEIINFAYAVGPRQIVERLWPDQKVGCLRVKILEMKDMKDLGMIKVLDAIWGLAPDDRWIHDYKGFYSVCDLCSESYLLLEEEDQ